jgi:hypothetical protein
VERAVIALAERQSGVIGYRQLRALGLSASWIKKRVTWGWLIPILHGVYAVGHRPRLLRGWHCAALLAAGSAAHWGSAAPGRTGG